MGYALATISDYGEQLKKCKRYYYRTWKTRKEADVNYCMNVLAPSSYTIGYIFLEEMRTTPVIAVYNASTGSENTVIQWGQNNNLISIDAIEVRGKAFRIAMNNTIKAKEIYCFHYEANAEL